jgi:two-component system, LytTR family, sensor kinase
MGNVIAYYRVLLLIAVTCCVETIFAQTSAGYTYEFYNSTHGLPSSEIISLAKDNKGFLWIGTSAGISRFDGYEFHNYNRSKEGDILGYVNAIAADRDHNLWIGTGAGLFCYYNNEIIKLSAPSDLPQGVNDIFTENDGTIWMATENGPAKIFLNDTMLRQSKKIRLTNYILPQWKFKNKSAADRRLDHIKKAADGTVYMSDLLRLFVVKENSIDLLYTIKKDRDHILSLFPVSRSKIFFTTTETEIHKVENGVHTNVQHKFLFQPGVHDELEGVWQMGTFGLYYFHPEASIASRFINTMEHGVDWPGAMLKDDNFFWVASHTGLVKIKPCLFATYNAPAIFPAHQDYYSFLQLKNGNLLLGSNRGTIILKENTGFDILQKNIVPTAEIKCLYEDERGWLWTGSGYQGLALIKNKQVKRFTVEDGLHDNSFNQFLKTSNGKLWAIGDHGVSEIIVDVKDVVSFKKYYRESGISRHSKFYSGIETPDGNLIIGGEEGLFGLKNDDLHPVMIDKKTQPVKSIIKDNEKNIWIATDGEGILKCAFGKDNNLEIVKQFTKADGLNTLHYLNLLADNENNIWAGSSIGLTLIGQQGKFKDKILNFDQSDGFTKPGYNSITLYQARDSTIWAGTTFGFISFKPDMAFLSSAPPYIYIAGIRQIKRNALMTDTSSYTRYSYNNNSFNFNFSALDYANPKGIQYFYKLEGLDTNWISAGNLRSVTYENLSPHNYSFRVKALNNKGKWSENDAVWSFGIKTPFWKQGWFILLCAGAIIALLLFFIRKREVKQLSLQKQKAAGYRDQLEIEQVINHFATSMNSIGNTDDLLWDVAKNCISKLNFEDCVIYLKDENQSMLIQKAALGPKTSIENLGNEQTNKINGPVAIPVGKGITGHVALMGKAEIVADTSLDERYIVDDERRFSEIAVPIIANETVIGVIDSEHSQKNFYTERHLQILTTIAALCATKINTFKAEQQTIEKEMEVLRLHKDFATSQLTALRMQMNPHFIFNALNSIQHYILQGNVVEANKYLSKFSKLQRDILHCSSRQFISLEKELEILTAYLQLEQFRFGGNFTYKINMTDEIEPVEIMIPPMILQPFVENSIWHGLMPLQTERKLSIYFGLESEDMLVACLRDNGIGRAASVKLKQRSGQMKTDHESKGMSMVQQRLQLLQQQYDKPFEAVISDIKDIKGNVMGTEVELKIFIGSKKV